MSEYVELYIDRGSEFATTIEINDDNTNLPQNVVSLTVRSSLRRSLVSPNVYASFQCTTDANSEGAIFINMTAANTANLRPGTYFFDVLTIEDGSDVRNRIIEGVVHVTQSITE